MDPWLDLCYRFTPWLRRCGAANDSWAVQSYSEDPTRSRNKLHPESFTWPDLFGVVPWLAPEKKIIGKTMKKFIQNGRVLILKFDMSILGGQRAAPGHSSCWSSQFQVTEACSREQLVARALDKQMKILGIGIGNTALKQLWQHEIPRFVGSNSIINALMQMGNAWLVQRPSSLTPPVVPEPGLWGFWHPKARVRSIICHKKRVCTLPFKRSLAQFCAGGIRYQTWRLVLIFQWSSWCNPATHLIIKIPLIPYQIRSFHLYYRIYSESTASTSVRISELKCEFGKQPFTLPFICNSNDYP